MGPKRPSCCGTITISNKFQDLAEPEPLETEVAFVSNGGNAGCEAANNLFHACSLGRKGGYCLGERLDAVFDPGRVLQEKR